MWETVYLKLQPYRQTSVALRKNLKLTAKFYGPFLVEDKVGQVAYQLKLRLVFNVSLLKHSTKGARVCTTLSTLTDEDEVQVFPVVILGRRTIQRGNQAVDQVLIHWSNLDINDAIWEDCTVIKLQFPAFNPRD